MEPEDKELKNEILRLIFAACNVNDIDMEAVDTSAPLIGPDSPLGLDSLDALEIVMAIQNKYNVRINSTETARVIIASVDSIAEFVKRKAVR